MEIIPHASQMCSVLLPILTADVQVLAVGAAEVDSVRRGQGCPMPGTDICRRPTAGHS